MAACLVRGDVTSGQEPVTSIEYVTLASRLDWSRATGEVAYDRAGPDLLFDLYVGLATANQRCLTCGDARFTGHNGNPAWHPSGQYVVFQAEDVSLPFLPPEKEHAKIKLTSPGWGTNNNLWLMSRNGASAWLLRRIDAGQATLHPQFSHDGRMLLWAEKVGLAGLAEQWIVRLADLTWVSGQPQLENVRDIAPFGIDTFYETHGFSSDDGRILFSAGDPATRSLDIFTQDLSTGAVQNLTNTPGVWDEHAHMSPDGTKIVWASASDIPIPRNYFVPYLDYWMMDADGGNRQRLTYFNEPTHPRYIETGAVATDFSFSADGSTMLARVELPQPSLGQRAEAIFRIRVNLGG